MARKTRWIYQWASQWEVCIQIALFVVPILVLPSYFIATHPLELAFNRAEIGSLFVAVIIGSMVCSDGQANWFKIISAEHCGRHCPSPCTNPL